MLFPSKMRERVTSVVAVAMHAALLAFAWWSPAPHFAPEARPPVDAMELFVETEEVEVRRTPPHVATSAVVQKSEHRTAPATRVGGLGNGRGRSSRTLEAAISAGEGTRPNGDGATGREGTRGDGFDPIGDAPDVRSLVTEIAVDAPSPRAPTTSPHGPVVVGEDVTRGLDVVLYTRDREEGIGSRAIRRMETAVSDATKKAIIHAGARARVAIDVGRDGSVASVRLVAASAGSDATWAPVVDDVRASLRGAPVDFGEAAEHAGAHVEVEAQLLFATANGTDGKPIIGECPTMPRVRADTSNIRGLFGDAPEPFFAIGGAPYGREPNGTCALWEPQGSKRQIEVRTQATVTFPDAPPLPVSHYPKPRKRPVSILFLILGLTPHDGS